MKISVITATYNREKSILRSIKSTKSQDYKNVELVMIDGGSSDETVELAKPYLTKNDILISNDAWMQSRTDIKVTSIGADKLRGNHAVEIFKCIEVI